MLRLHGGSGQFFAARLRELTEAAKELAELEKPADPERPDGGSIRSVLKKGARAGHYDPRLDGGKPPEGFEYLFDVWLQARGGAAEGFSGVRLTWRDLADYQAVTGIALDAFEVEAIMAMDAAAAKALRIQDGRRDNDTPA